MTSDFGRMGRWLLLAALLMPLCSSGASARGGAPTRPVNVVLVHGILNTGKIFDPLVHRLEAEGCRCFAPDLRPNTCRLGVHDLARKLSGQIDGRFGPTEPFVLVGFSMGGVVARDYVQNFAARGRVRMVFLISAPNHGTFWACLSPGGGVRDLALGSPFLQRLNMNDDAWKGMPVYSYWTPYDLMILPATSSFWPVGTLRRIACPLHPLMVKNHEVVADIAAKMTGLARSRQKAPAQNR